VLKGLKQNKCFTGKLKNIWRKLEDTRIRLPPRNKGLFILWDIEIGMPEVQFVYIRIDIAMLHFENDNRSKNI
jgi:hypothetical protein